MLVAFVGLEAPSIIVIVAEGEPLRRDFLYKVSYLAIVIPVF